MPRSFHLLTLCAALACGEPPPSDASVYAAIMADPAPDPASALPRCLALANEHARGDCAMVVALRAGQAPDIDPEAYCEQVPAGLWRYECYFEAAENSRGWRPREEQAALCRAAGPFIDDCGQHLWQNAVMELLRGKGAYAFPTMTDDARVIYATWEPSLGAGTDFARRFWRHLFWTGFEIDGPPMDLSICAALDDDLTPGCRATGARLFVTRLRRSLLSGDGPGRPPVGGPEAFCEAERDLAALSARWPSAGGAADPALEQAVAEEYDRICRRGEPVFQRGPGGGGGSPPPRQRTRGVGEPR